MKHGTETGYDWHKCKCDACTGAKASAVRRRSHRNRSAANRGKAWTSAEIAFVIECGPGGYLHTAYEVAVQLGRSVHAIDMARYRARHEEPALPQYAGFDDSLRLPSGF